MTERKERELVVEYWYRTLLSVSLSFADITKIIVEFGEAFERFEESLASECIKIEENGTVLLSQAKGYTCNNAFGVFNAISGYKYHWKVQIMQSTTDKRFQANIGIIEADKCEEYLPAKIWCCLGKGYAYYSYDGNIFHNSYSGDKYGNSFAANDIIDIRLNLKNDHIISWCKNGIDYGIGFEVKKNTEYKLAVGLYFGKVQLISLDIIE